MNPNCRQDPGGKEVCGAYPIIHDAAYPGPISESTAAGLVVMMAAGFPGSGAFLRRKKSKIDGGLVTATGANQGAANTSIQRGRFLRQEVFGS